MYDKELLACITKRINALKLYTYKLQYISRDAFKFLRQVRAIVGRAQQVAKPSASFRIFVTALSTMQDAFPYSLKRVRERGGGEEERERKRRESNCRIRHNSSLRVMERKGIRRDRKY